jgi:hypothetical protein
MRVNVNNMDSEMRLLRQNMELIASGSSKVNTSLVEKRNRINQLSNVHSLLRKVRHPPPHPHPPRAVHAHAQRCGLFEWLTWGSGMGRGGAGADPIRV